MSRSVPNFKTRFSRGYYIGLISSSAGNTTQSLIKAYYCTIPSQKLYFTSTAGTYEVYIEGTLITSGTINPHNINIIDFGITTNLIDMIVEVIITKSALVEIPMFIGTIVYFNGSSIKVNSNSMWFANMLMAKIVSTSSSGLTEIESSAKWIWDNYLSDRVSFIILPYGENFELNSNC